ncbi:MAG: class I SAM-dependent methyltransferase [Candidatus Dependentiae bacterium]|nr:class I SAM-dependent methyltransferase [Candidatus Dependentiae bacterium]
MNVLQVQSRKKTVGRVLGLVISLFCFTQQLESIGGDRKLSLDQLALQTGTDKSSAFHAYTAIYDKFFSGIRHKPIKFLEIGIYKGASIALWDRYFDNAQTRLHFIDIDPQAVALCKNRSFSSRIDGYIVNQEDKESLRQFVATAGQEYDIIIDDGGHTMDQQKNSFEVLFPTLKKGGVYIIEDLHTSYWPVYGGGTADSTINFLCNLVHDINAVGAQGFVEGDTQTFFADFNKFDRLFFKNYYQEHIDSITFYGSLCFIFKR